MKKLILSLSVIAVLVISQSASADSRYGRRGYSGYYGDYGNYYPSRYNSYNYGYRRGGSYFDFGYGGYYPRYRRRHYDSGAFVGGLVLGSLLSYPRYSRRYDRGRLRLGSVKGPVDIPNRGSIIESATALYSN